MTGTDDALQVYLDDHWAGAGAGSSLARRLRRNNADTRWATKLGWLADQITEDEDTLAALRRTLGLESGALKRSLALVSERVSRVKFTGKEYSPLSRVLETEALMAGVAAKGRLWSALLHGASDRPALVGFDFATLRQRADEQLDTLRSFHEQCARIAFGSAGVEELRPD